MFVKDKTKIVSSSRVCGIKWVGMYFVYLLLGKFSLKKFSLEELKIIERLAEIQEEIWCRAFWKLSTTWMKIRWIKEKTKDLCACCVRCDVSSARMALFTFCFMHHNSAKCHILGVVHPGGGYDPQIRTPLRFLYDAPPKFHRPVFTRSEVIVLTNTPTKGRSWRKHSTFFATLRRWVKSRVPPA